MEECTLSIDVFSDLGTDGFRLATKHPSKCRLPFVKTLPLKINDSVRITLSGFYAVRQIGRGLKVNKRNDSQKLKQNIHFCLVDLQIRK